MTTQEAITLADFALKAMPKSSDEQRVVLLAAIEKYPEPVVADAIVQHAAESEFISTPKILDRVRAVIGGSNAQRMEREALERLQKAQRESAERLGNVTDAEHMSVVSARNFCHQADPAQLDQWRVEIEAGNPALEREWRGKETAALVGGSWFAPIVFQKYGRIPRECWAGVA